MKTWILVLTAWFSLAPLVLIPSLAAPQKDAGPAAKDVPMQPKSAFDIYHAGRWEQRIGYSQAVRSGHMLYISGSNEKRL
jgi:hypothetical protein